MRARIMLIGLAALAACGAASAASAHRHRPAHRPTARHAVRPPAGPAHHMSALAAAAGQRSQSVSFTADTGSHAPYVQFRAGGGDARFGAFRRSYQMDADRPLVMPDADGAVGLSLKFKSH